MASSFEFDTRQLEAGMKRYGQAGTKAILKGLVISGDALLADATDRIPFDKGFNGGAAGSGSKKEPTLKGDSAEVQVGFNVPYAARLHEDMSLNISQRRTSNGQVRSQKYLEKPMKENGEKYGKIIAQSMKQIT